ncbi:TPA: hypothetical protein WLN44_001987, partial [Neisseria gonorrhoeae]
AGNVLVGVSQIRLHIRAAAIAFTCRPRCGREEKRREEKRREEKRREGFLRAGFIFGSLYRFDRLKKRFSLMLKGGLYRVPGGVSAHSTAPAARFCAFGAFGGGKFAYFSRVGRA